MQARVLRLIPSPLASLSRQLTWAPIFLQRVITDTQAGIQVRHKAAKKKQNVLNGTIKHIKRAEKTKIFQNGDRGRKENGEKHSDRDSNMMQRTQASFE